MKKLFLLFILFCVGCAATTSYHKQITVEKDGQGKIIKTTIVEGIIQPNLSSKVMQPKYLGEGEEIKLSMPQ